jgi:hypothetical protein
VCDYMCVYIYIYIYIYMYIYIDGGCGPEYVNIAKQLAENIMVGMDQASKVP